MSREWSPGDVAIVCDPVEGCRRMVYVANTSLPCWHDLVTERCLDARQALSARPLVVIDPEDREQVEDLCRRYVETYGGRWDGREKPVSDMQAALRSLIEPPKPEEPTDPTTRVTDRRDNIWRLLADGEWVCTSGPDIGEYLAWDQLAGDRGPVSIEVTP